MDLRLRVATCADHVYLQGLNCRAYRDVAERQYGVWDEAKQRERFAKKLEEAEFRIIELERQAVGAVWMLELEDCFVLRDLMVSPEFQLGGIGSRVLSRETERADAAGNPIRLHTLLSNPAQRLYARHAFVETQRDDTFVDMQRKVGGWSWRFVGSCADGALFELGGANVWSQRWKAVPGLFAHVKDPAWGQARQFPVYELAREPRPILFAAGEFSPNVWGFFLADGH